jgi:hypothetical protein
MLASMSLATRPEALMILKSNSFTFCTFFHAKECLLQTVRRENPEEINLENEGAWQWVLRPLFLFNDQETPCPERQEHEGSVS